MSEKPMGVMTFSILAIFLGVMGVLGGAVGFLGLLLDQQAPPDDDPKLAEVNAEFAKRIKALTDETKPLTKIVSGAIMAASALLAAAGIAGIQLQGRGFVLTALASNLIVDLFAGYFGIMVQMKSAAIMKWYFGETARVTNMPAAFATWMGISMYAGAFFALGWLILKVVYYVWGLAYFTRKSVRDTYSGRPAPNPGISS